METRTKAEELELNTMLEHVKKLQQTKAALEIEVAGVQSEINHYCTVVVPEFCDDTKGAPKGFLGDGTEWTVEKKYSVSQPKETKEQFHQWLDANGFENLLKRKVQADLGKADSWKAENFMQIAKENGYEVTQSTDLAAATCRKWVVNRIKDRLSVPDHLVNVHSWHVVKFKKAT